MSAKPCKGCGKSVVFAKDRETGKWQVLDNTAPVWKQIGTKDGVAYVMREPSALVSHFATCSKANDFSSSKKTEAPMQTEDRHFSEPKEIDYHGPGSGCTCTACQVWA